MHYLRSNCSMLNQNCSYLRKLVLGLKGYFCRMQGLTLRIITHCAAQQSRLSHPDSGVRGRRQMLIISDISLISFSNPVPSGIARFPSFRWVIVIAEPVRGHAAVKLVSRVPPACKQHQAVGKLLDGVLAQLIIKKYTN